MIVNENNPLPYIQSLTACLSKVIMGGYTEDFRITKNGLEAIQHHKIYQPEEINIINFFKFEAPSDPDYAILYIIETNDGTKGTLKDVYGVYMNDGVSDFVKHIKTIQKNRKE